MRTRLDMRTALRLLCATTLIAAIPGSAAAAERPATTSSLGSVFAAAQPGDTVLLAAGNYGRFEGGMKSGEVTIKPQPGAVARIELYFAPASNITVDGLTIDDVVLGDSATKNITVRNSDIPGQVTVRSGEMSNGNVLFDHNVHRDWNKCDNCGEGRVFLPGGDDNKPIGMTIQNSEFKGGMSDGIQTGADGLKILNNTFHDLVAGTPDGVHTDAIQLYGSKNTIIRGNYFHDVGSKIMAPDGAYHELIEDNVFGPGLYPYAIMLWSDDGSTIRHNTLATGSCWFNLRCGIISLGQKTGGCQYADSCDPGRGTVIQDNILTEISVSEGTSASTSSFNLFGGSSRNGQGDKKGAPKFVSASPASWADYALASGSAGKGDASDGLDRGIRVANTNPPPPSTIVAPPSSTTSSVRVLSSLRSIRKSGRLRLRLTIAEAGEVTVSASVRPKGRKLVKLKAVSLGQVPAGTRTLSIKLKRSAQRSIGRARSARLSVSMKVGATTTRAKLKIKRS